MRILNDSEFNYVSGGEELKGFAGVVRGGMVGAYLGWQTGSLIGYKWSKGGGWIAGAIAQFVGYIGSGAVGFTVGTVVGAVSGEQAIWDMCHRYASMFGPGENGKDGSFGGMA